MTDSEVLHTVWELGGDNVKSIEVYRRLCLVTGRDPALADVYMRLDRLERMGLLSSMVTPGGPERGYRPDRRFTTVTRSEVRSNVKPEGA